MVSVRHLPTPVVGMLLVVSLAACAAEAAPTPVPTRPAEPPPASAGPVPSGAAARHAYSAAICPLFSGIVALDPRLAAMRQAGADGGDMTEHSGELEAISAELLVLLEGLEAVPAWDAGASLRHQLITALHGIRAELLHVSRDPGARTAAADLDELPYIASAAMDLAMEDAVSGGLTCEPGS